MRKKAALFLSMAFLVSLSGCKIIDRYENDPKRLERDYADEIFHYIQNEDIDSLCGLFCEEIRQTHDLEAEWETFFARVDGNFESYDGLSFPVEGYGVDKSGKVFDNHLFVNYNGAYTDTGAVYDEFGYFVYRTHPYAPEYEGVNYFAIYLPEDDDWIMVGDTEP